ncbi:unnamed protein product, partial [Didymodactylos carnosus]
YCGGDRPKIHPNPLEALHNAVRRQSLVEFRRAVQMGKAMTKYRNHIKKF